MLIDQKELDALLAQAGTLHDQAAPATATPATVAAGPPPPAAGPFASAPQLPPAAVPSSNTSDAPEVRRLLRLRVPVIVRLAYRPMAIGVIRKLASGSIIEFEQTVEDDLDFLINNHPIGRGVCVKVGEHFGIRLTRIEPKSTRIRSLGR